MGDTSGCQISSNNLAVYLQGVSVTPSVNITSDYFVTASLPSSASTKRVWNFTSQGTLTGTAGTLVLDYTEAKKACPLYNISFEGALTGTYIVKNQVFSANKFISYAFDGNTIITLTLKIPKSIVDCYGTGKTLSFYFTANINDTTVNTLVYGTSSSGTGYTYTDGSGNPDQLTVSSALDFAWTSIATGDAVNVYFDSGTQSSLLYYGENPTTSSNYVEYLSDASGGTALVDFGSTASDNWAFYYDYASQSSYPVNGGGDFTFAYGSNSNEFTIPPSSASNTFTFDIVNAAVKDIYIVVGNISSGEVFTVTQTGNAYGGFNVNGYDLAGNSFSYSTPSTTPNSTTYTYTGSGWVSGYVNLLVYGTSSSGTGYTYTSSGGVPDSLSISSSSQLPYVWSSIATGDAVDVYFGSGSQGSLLYYGENPNTSSPYYVEYTTADASGGISLIDFGSTAGKNWAFYYDYGSQSSYPVGGGGTFIFAYGSTSNSNQFTIPSTSASNTFTFDIVNAFLKDIYIVVGNISSGDFFTVTQIGNPYGGFNVYLYDLADNSVNYQTISTTPNSTTFSYTGSGWNIGYILVYGTSSSGTGYTYTDGSGNPDSLSISSLTPLDFSWSSIATGNAVDVSFGAGSQGSSLYYGKNPSTSSPYYVEYLSDSGARTGAGIALIDFGSTASNNWAFYYDYASQSSYPVNGGGTFTFTYGSTSNSNEFTIPSTSASNTFTFDIVNAPMKDIYIVVGNISSGNTFTVTQTGTANIVNVYGYDLSGNSFSYQTPSSTPNSTTYTYTESGWVSGDDVNVLVYGTSSSGTGYTYTSIGGRVPDSLLISSSSQLPYVWSSITTRDAVDVYFGSGSQGSLLYYGENPSTSSPYYVEYTTADASGGVSLIDFGSKTGNNWAFYYDYGSQSSYPVGGGGNFTFTYGSTSNSNKFTIPSTSASNTFTFEIVNAFLKDIYIVVGNISSGDLFTVTQEGNPYSGFNVYGYDLLGKSFMYSTGGSTPNSTYYTYTGSGWSIGYGLVYGTPSSGTGYTYTDGSGNPDSLSISSLTPLDFSWSSIATGDAVDVYFGSGSQGSLLYYGENPSTSSPYYVEYTTADAGGVSLIDFGSKTGNNWAFYYDYASQSSYPLNGGGTFIFTYGSTSSSNQFTIPSTSDSSGTFTFEIVNAFLKDIYIVVGNISSGDLFTVTQEGNVYSGFNVNGYDLAGNSFSYKTISSTPNSTTYTYTGSGWSSA